MKKETKGLPTETSRSATDTKITIFAEIILLFFPFAVFAIVFFQQRTLGKLFYIPEWSFAASLITGQAIVKLISGAITNKNTVNSKRVMLIFVLMLLFFVMSLAVLMLILSNPVPDMRLAIVQLLIFSISVFLFRIIGAVGENMLSN